MDTSLLIAAYILDSKTSVLCLVHLGADFFLYSTTQDDASLFLHRSEMACVNDFTDGQLAHQNT